jgi:hypothetical protein
LSQRAHEPHQLAHAARASGGRVGARAVEVDHEHVERPSRVAQQEILDLEVGVRAAASWKRPDRGARGARAAHELAGAGARRATRRRRAHLRRVRSDHGRPERARRAARGDEQRARHRRARPRAARGRAQLGAGRATPQIAPRQSGASSPPWRTGRRWMRSLRPGSARIAVAVRRCAARRAARARRPAVGQPSAASGSASAASTSQ